MAPEGERSAEAGAVRLSSRERLRGSVRARLQGSWVQELFAELGAVDFGNAITLIGAALLLSMLPLVILLGALADERVDDDVSRHIGLDNRGANVVHGLFKSASGRSAGAIVLGLLVAFAGVLALTGQLQEIYERAFHQEHRGWRDLPRFLAWVLGLLVLLVVEASVDDRPHSALALVVRIVVGAAVLTAFFGWTMHLLLAGRVAWRRLIRPAVVTAVLWLVLSAFSGLYFSSSVVSDSRLYGPIGVVFTLTAWFIAIGAVIVFGAVGGVVWQRRHQRRVAGEDAETSVDAA